MESYREKLKLQNVVFAIGCVALALFSVLGFLGEAGVVKLAPSVGDGHWQSLWRGFISGASFGILAMLLFGLTFVINFLLSLRQIHVSQPVELLHGGAQGEREPKTKLLTAVLGFMLLGVGYYLALTSQSSMDALDKFFNAIALVMVGTYCLFSAGSIAFLKILKKNKNYYYQTRHFTSISGMLYRMKQNAVGLANICILSTGVLLVISISTCLWTGIEEVTYTRFPHQISIEANTGVSGIMKTVEPVSQKMIEEVKTGIDQHLEEKQLRKKYESDQRYYVMLADVDRNKVEKTQSDDAAASTLIKIMEESEYKQVTGEQVELEPGQALVFQEKHAGCPCSRSQKRNQKTAYNA